MDLTKRLAMIILVATGFACKTTSTGKSKTLSELPGEGRSTCAVGKPCCDLTDDAVVYEAFEDIVKRIATDSPDAFAGSRIDDGLFCCANAQSIAAKDGTTLIGCKDAKKYWFEIDEIRKGSRQAVVKDKAGKINSTCKIDRPCCDLTDDVTTWGTFGGLLNRMVRPRDGEFAGSRIEDGVYCCSAAVSISPASPAVMGCSSSATEQFVVDLERIRVR